MVGRQKLGLFRNVVVVATVVGATASASAFIEENLVGVRRTDGSHGHSSYVKVSNTAGEDNLALAPHSIRSLPVPLMERRALLTVTDEGHESVSSVGGIRKQRKRRQRHLRSNDVNSDVSGARGSKEPFSASNTAGEDNLAPHSIRSLPVPLMERRALLTVTDEGHESVGRVGGIRKQRKRPQRHLRSDDVISDVSGARGSKEPFSASSVRHHHPPCDEIEISASYLSASETTLSSYLPENVIDGDLDTHWATEGSGSWLMIDLPETTALQGLEVAFAGNADGSRDASQSFTMLVIGENKVIHRPEANVGETRGLQYLSFERQFFLAKSVVFVGYGREGHTSLAEMKLCGAQVEVPSRSSKKLADNHLPQRSIPSRSPKELADKHLPQRSTSRQATRNLRGSRRPQA
ncbi:unnamed protein product [Ascophyllum nodosum]